MRILITGTGAGVGKTWVGQALALALRSAGKEVVAIKAVETGCYGPPGEREDGVLVAQATGQSHPTHAFSFAGPRAPHPLERQAAATTAIVPVTAVNLDGMRRKCAQPSASDRGPQRECDATQGDRTPL